MLHRMDGTLLHTLTSCSCSGSSNVKASPMLASSQRATPGAVRGLKAGKQAANAHLLAATAMTAKASGFDASLPGRQL